MTHDSDQHNLPASERIIDPALGYAEVTDRILKPVFRKGYHPLWLIGFGLSFMVLGMMAISGLWLLVRGVGVWGLNVPVAWGFAIINFVWWIGIGHAGTLISAVLLLLRQNWRTSINRFAEAMTLFAVACAGLFPLFHLGRITRFYYLLPYPSTLSLWPQWRSPLVWDVFAVMTYGTVSLVFWYLGLVPDLATMRDRSPRKWVRIISGVLAMGWRGSARHWARYQSMYLLLAGLATPLVLSVHSIVSLDFSVSLLPGWHSTIFPPYFVAGAIYAGFAMVIILSIPLRAAFNLRDLITDKHLDLMAKVMLTSGLIVAYGYAMETFTAWFSGDKYEQFLVQNRALGPYGPYYWANIICNVVVAQLLWFRAIRRSPAALFVIALIISIGMWLERFVIVVVSLHRDFLPSSWGMYSGTVWDWTLYLGTIGLFLTLFFVFVRLLPSVSAFEVRELLHHMRHGQSNDDASVEDETYEYTEIDPALTTGTYGVMAEFRDPESLLDAAKKTTAHGYVRTAAFSPFPVDGLCEALGQPKTRMPRVALVGAIVGACAAYWGQWYTATVAYPLDIGGRPPHSWPSFIPLTFEMAILGAAMSMFVGMIIRNRFPQPYHPVFDTPGFDRASTDRFFLCVERVDPRFDESEVSAFLETCSPLRVSRVPRRVGDRDNMDESVPVTV